MNFREENLINIISIIYINNVIRDDVELELSPEEPAQIIACLNFLFHSYCLERNSRIIDKLTANKLAVNFLLDHSSLTHYYSLSERKNCVCLFSAPKGNTIAIIPPLSQTVGNTLPGELESKKDKAYFLDNLKIYNNIKNWDVQEDSKYYINHMNQIQLENLKNSLEQKKIDEIEEYARAFSRLNQEEIVFLATLRTRELFMDWLFNICNKLADRLVILFRDFSTDFSDTIQKIEKLNYEVSDITEKIESFFKNHKDVEKKVSDIATKYNFKNLKRILEDISFSFEETDLSDSDKVKKTQLFFFCLCLSKFFRWFINFCYRTTHASKSDEKELIDLMKVMIESFFRGNRTILEQEFLNKSSYWTNDNDFQEKFRKIRDNWFKPIILVDYNYQAIQSLINMPDSIKFKQITYNEGVTAFYKFNNYVEFNRESQELDNWWNYAKYIESYLTIEKNFKSYSKNIISPKKIHDFVLRFPWSFKQDIVEMLLEVKYLSEKKIRTLLTKSIDKIIQDLGGTKFYVINIGESYKSSPRIMRLLKDILEKSNFSFIFTSLDNLEYKLRSDNIDNDDRKIIFIDDQILSGIQISREFFQDIEQTDSKLLKLLEVPLKSNVRKFIKENEIHFFTIYGRIKGKERIEKRGERRGLNVKVHYCQELRSEKYFSCEKKIFLTKHKLEFKELLQNIGYELLRDTVSNHRARKWYSLGYGDMQLLNVVLDNTASSTITCLWKKGIYKNSDWEPLFPRTISKHSKLEALEKRIIEFLMWKSYTYDEISKKLGFTLQEIKKSLKRLIDLSIVIKKGDVHSLRCNKEDWKIKINEYIEKINKYSNNGKEFQYGTTRLAFTDEEHGAIEWARRKITELNLGYSFQYDQFLNLHVTWEQSSNTPRILVGTHLDSVLNGGKFDGTIGFITFLITMKWVSQFQSKLAIPIDFIIFRAEESTVYKTALLGSKAACGLMSFEELRQMQYHSGAEDDDAIIALYKKADIDEGLLDPIATIKQITRKLEKKERTNEIQKDCWFFKYKPKEYCSYLEVHIDQDDTLTKRDLNFGIVNSIRAPYRVNIEITGQTDHSGATPMENRKDALCCASECISMIENLCIEESKRNDIVGTIGTLSIPNMGINKIPGKCIMGFDLRSNNKDYRDNIYNKIKSNIEQICDKRNMYPLKFNILEDDTPVILDKNSEIQKKLREIMKNKGFKADWIQSGAGHDAKSLALKDIPVGLLFIPNTSGISHHPKEEAKSEDIFNACIVLYEIFTKGIKIKKKTKNKIDSYF